MHVLFSAALRGAGAPARKACLLRAALVALLLAGIVFPWNTGKAQGAGDTAAVLTCGDYEYRLEDGCATIVHYAGQDREVKIPQSLDGYPVRKIGADAFNGYKISGEVQRVVIPKGVTAIGASAFSYSEVRSVVIPDSVVELGDDIFAECVSLASVNLPKNITEIPAGMFSVCGSLKSLQIPGGVTSIKRYAFLSSGLTSIRLPAAVTDIGDGAFAQCYELESVTLPKQLEGINQEAFAECISLKKIVIPAGVRYISAEAFRSCSALSSVTIPDSVEWIGARAFQGCDALKTAAVPSTVAGISSNAFEKGTMLLCEEGSAADRYAYNAGQIAKYPDGTTSVPKGAKYQRVNLIIGNKSRVAYAVDLGSYPLSQIGSLSIVAQHPRKGLNSYPFIACGNIEKCYGLTFYVKVTDIQCGDPLSVAWKGMVLTGSNAWSAGASGAGTYLSMNEKERMEVFFSSPSSIVAWDAVPGKDLRDAWSYSRTLYPDRLYFASGDAAQAYLDSIGG